MTHRFVLITLAVVPAVFLSLDALAAGGSCLPRALTAAEKDMGERVATRLLKLLPPAPSGWKVRDNDVTDIGSGSCLDSNTKKMVPQPVGVTVKRSFLSDSPTPAPVAAKAAPPAASSSAFGPEQQARAQALEQQIAELKRREQDATAGYIVARRAGDSEAQKKASEEARELRAAMGPPQKELRELRDVERRQRAAESKASSDAAFAHAKEELANRRIAAVAFYANSGQKQVRASKPVSVPGVPLALYQGMGATHLLFGDWKHFGHYAASPFDPSAPTTRVQDVSVRIDGNDAVTALLLGKIDLKALQAVMQR